MLRSVALLFMTLCYVGCDARDQQAPSRAAETTAIATSQHPYAGFWKDGHCNDDFGLAIAPAGPNLYSVSFCGPGGCFEPGTYRPNTPIEGDPSYRVVDKDTIEVSTTDGQYQRYIRCGGGRT